MSYFKRFKSLVPLNKLFSRYVTAFRFACNPKERNNQITEKSCINSKRCPPDDGRRPANLEAKSEQTKIDFNGALIDKIRDATLKQIFKFQLFLPFKSTNPNEAHRYIPKLIHNKCRSQENTKYCLETKVINKVQKYIADKRNFENKLLPNLSNNSKKAFEEYTELFFEKSSFERSKISLEEPIANKRKYNAIEKRVFTTESVPKFSEEYSEEITAQSLSKFHFEPKLLSKIQVYIENKRKFADSLLSKPNQINREPKIDSNNSFKTIFPDKISRYTSERKDISEKLLNPESVTNIKKMHFHGQKLESTFYEICRKLQYPISFYSKERNERKSKHKINIKKKNSRRKDNLAAVLYGINDLRLEQWPIPIIQEDEVLLQMECVGICGSDVHYLVNGRIGNFVLNEPMIIGHEGAGTVVEVGTKVSNLEEGDRVAIEPGVPCRYCDYCKKGRYNLCPNIVFCATPPVHGNLSRFYAQAADFCYKLPDHVSFEEGTLLEPLSVAVYACKRAKVHFGSTVFISGSGPIGLVTVLTAKAFGASFVIITDRKNYCLQLAESLGADCPILLDGDEKSEDIVEKIKDAMGGELPSVSIECCGTEQSVRTCIRGTKTGGCAVMVGMGKSNVKVPIMETVCREIDILGSFRYLNNYPTSLEMVASGKVDVKPIITHHFPMEESKRAFEIRRTGEGNAVKVIIHVNSNWKSAK